MSHRRILWFSLILILGLALAACGAKPSTEGGGSGAEQPTAQPAAASSPAAKPAEQSQPTVAPATAAPTTAPTTASAGDTTAAPAATAAEPSAGATEDPEPNTLAEAVAIEAGTTSASLIEADEDWFAFSVPASGILTVALTPDGAAQPMEIVLLEAGDEIGHEYSVQPSVTKTMSRVLSSAEGMDYAVTILSGPGKYTLDVTIESQDDAGSGADAGDSPASAVAITAGKVITGMVGDLDEKDLYSLDVKAGTVLGLSFAATDDSGDKRVALLDGNQDEIWSEYNVGNVVKSYRIILGHDNAGTYYVLVWGDKGTYEFETTAEPQNDAGSGQDAGDKPVSAIAVELGKTYTGLMGDWDEYDLFKFDAKGGDMLSVTFTPGDDVEPLSVAVLDIDMNEMWSEYNIGPGSAKTFAHILDADAGGAYYVAVTDGKGTYTLNLAVAAQNDAGSGKDAGDKPASAVVIEPNASYTGQIGGSDVEDLFKFEVEEGSVISVSFSPAANAEPISVGLWEPDLNELWSEYSVGPGVEKAYTYVVGSELGGTYYVWVGNPEGQDSYTFEVKVSSQDDGGSGGDAGDTPGQAVDVGPDVEFTGLVGDEDWQDYYRFDPEVGQRIVVTSGPDADGLGAAVLDGDENALWEEYDITPGDSVEYDIDDIEGETPYYLYIWGDSGTYTAIIESAS